ncbi:uncharacterized protein FOMMEDRAFT_25349 [Fomitiporia mediterranea MF3/22]|uniref:uncharacterized protein n=1 Tax=Fomitiporia mediterranea (strain MF3/22) TaxID=694068 RepID=UPI0004407762|nr:uncharacterized protein FOMMEDRAFT_25349 [Fomitiporia mediterranea MF3/22]EJD08188.1 hypothetical protein FOMMEDRAFT_25349 [Fomitiporia mediterranea MF3/22]
MAEDPKSSDGRKHRTTSSTSGGPLAGHPDPPERTSEDRQDVTTVLQDKRQSHFDKVLGILEGSVVDVTALLQLHFGTTAIKKSATDTYSPRTSRWARCLVSPDCKHVSRAKVPACKHPEYPIAVLYLLYMTLKKDLEHISTFHSLPDIILYNLKISKTFLPMA